MIKVGQIYKIKDNYLVVKAISKKGTKLIVRHSFRNKNMVIPASALLQAKKVAYFKKFSDAVSCPKWETIVTRHHITLPSEKILLSRCIKRVPPKNYIDDDYLRDNNPKIKKEKKNQLDDFLEPKPKRKKMHKDLLTDFLESFE